MMPSLGTLLRRRLLAGLFLLLVVVSVGLYLIVRHLLTSQVERALKVKTRLLAAMVTQEPNGELEIDFAENPMPEFRRPENPEYFQFWLSDGRILKRSPSLGDRDLPFLDPGEDGDARFRDVTLPDGRPGHLAVVRLRPRREHEARDRASGRPPAPLVTVAVAADRARLDRALERVAWALVGSGALLLVGAALVVAQVLGRGLRPLEAVAELAAKVDPVALEGRFPEANVPSELAAISERLNHLLDRVRAGVERERRFSANVAHELRTPLAELRCLAEVALRFPAGRDQSDVLRDVLESSLQMERLVNTLLDLARHEAAKTAIESRDFDLTQLVREIWRTVEGAAQARDLRWTLVAPEVAPVRTDRTLLSAVLVNLVENAVDHSIPGTGIQCVIEATDARWKLVLTNHQATLGQEDLPHLFEPFWRKDAARTSGAHGGLGLALVASYVKVLGLKMKVGLPEPDFIQFSLSAPSPVGCAQHHKTGLISHSP